MKAFALVLAFAAVPAAAQSPVPADAFPLEVGNRWEYLVSYPSGTLSWEIVGDTTVAGERIARMRFDTGAVCGVRTTLYTQTQGLAIVLVDRVDPGQRCASAPATFPGNYDIRGNGGSIPVFGYAETATVNIGSTAVTGIVRNGPVIQPEVGIHYQEGTRTLDGIGMVDLFRTVGGTGNPQTEVLRYRLTYARIRGVEYGQPVATAADDAPGAAATALTVGPNPAQTAATLRFAAAARPAEALVTDALGRVVRRVAVPAGATEARLDVSELAAGVYVATVGAASVRLVVAR